LRDKITLLEAIAKLIFAIANLINSFGKLRNDRRSKPKNKDSKCSCCDHTE